MKNKKFEKLLVKAGITAVMTFAMGLAYRINKDLDTCFDEKYEKEHNVPKKLF